MAIGRAVASCSGGTGFDSHPMLHWFVVRICTVQVVLRGYLPVNSGHIWGNCQSIVSTVAVSTAARSCPFGYITARVGN